MTFMGISESGVLSRQQILFNFYFSQTIGDAVFCSFRAIFFSDCFPPSHDKLLLQSPCFVRISGICGCFWFLGTSTALQRGQLPFSRMFFTGSQGWSPGSQLQAALSMSGFLSRQYLLFTDFPF